MFTPSRHIRWSWHKEPIAASADKQVMRWFGYDGERRMCAILGRIGPVALVYRGGRRDFGGVVEAKQWANEAFALQIVAVRWTDKINVVAIVCECGARFEHRADRWRVECACGRSADLGELRERVTWN